MVLISRYSVKTEYLFCCDLSPVVVTSRPGCGCGYDGGCGCGGGGGGGCGGGGGGGERGKANKTIKEKR